MKELRNFLNILRRTYWGDLLYRCMKYSPVVYYLFLALYCIGSVILGRDRISPLAILPYIYSFIAPGILLFVVLAVRIIASILYHDWRFRSNSGASLVTILIAILMAYLPNISGLYDSVLKPISFRWIDYLLITLSLWELAIRVLFSTDRWKEEVEVLLGWFDRIDDVAIKGILIQSALMGIPGGILVRFVQVLDIRDTLVGLSFLALGYLSIAFIRWFTVDSQIGFTSVRDTLLRKLLERDLHSYSKEFDIREKKANTDECKKDREPL